MINNKFGVVVIGKDEGERLKRCLESLAYIAECTVYVDSQSSDSSAELASDMGFHVIVLDDSKPVSRPRARNEGYQFLKKLYSQMVFVQFQDGDTMMADGWLEAAHQKFDELSDAAIVCGMLQEKDRELSVYRKLCDIEWYRESGEVELTGGIAAIRVEALEVVGLYNEGIRGEDFELCRRFRENGWKIFCIDRGMGIHDSGIDSFEKYWQRGVKSGYAYLGQFARDRKSIIKWFIILMMLLTMLVIYPVLGVVILMVFPVKVFHIAYQNRCRTRSFGDALIYGIHCIVSNYAELYGMLKYYFSRQKILSD